MSKYGNKKTWVNEIMFDSLREAKRYNELRILEKAGYITDLELQKSFVLITGRRWSDGKKHRDTVYRADFVYRENGEVIVEDAKGVRTPVYKLKKELMKDIYGIEIREV